jgi:hypothetical protein
MMPWGNQGDILNIINSARLVVAASLALGLAGCSTTSQEAFRQNPKGVPKVDICRTLLQTQDPNFAREMVAELTRRSVNPYDCPSMVQKQDQAGAALAVIAVGGAAVAYCANHNCGGGGYGGPRYPGNCYSYYDRAADGSLCGYRAAMVRPGGY